jgi:C1A family cysteine protease
MEVVEMRKRREWISVILAFSLVAAGLPQQMMTSLAQETQTTENDFETETEETQEEQLEEILNSDTAKELSSIDMADMTPEQLEKKAELDRQIEEQYQNNYIDVEEEAPVATSEYKNYIPSNRAQTSSYDPRTGGSFTIPDVRDQNPLGTCWAHTAMCMVEMNLAKNGRYQASVNDMSEFQTVYFMNHDWTDPLGLCTNDNFHCKNEDDSTNSLSSEWYDGGNNLAYVKYMMMDWVGAVSEKEYTQTEYSILKKDKENAVLDDSYAMEKDAAHVQDVTVVNLKEDPDVVKQLIKSRGAVGSAYYSDENYYNSTENGKNYYCSKSRTTNHAITLVGWDDNYSKDNFTKEKPANNGAWLVRNSWGSDWGDGGYFWMSYEEASLADTAYAVEAYTKSDADNYYTYNYQYDGGISTAAGRYIGYTSVQEANVFKANGKEVLKAVSIYTNANYGYTIDIYKNLTDSSDPLSGEKQSGATKSGTQLYEGYHTIKLGSNVSLSAGDTFSVVVTLENKNGEDAKFCYDKTFDAGWMYSSAEAKAGESFVRPSEKNSWSDLGADSKSNLRIKAYTVDDVKTAITKIAITESEIELKAGEVYDLAEGNRITVEPADTDDSVIYSSDNEMTASVDSNGKITANRPGTAVITAKARIGTQQDSITVKVSLEKPAESISLSSDTLTVTKGLSKKITAVLTPEDVDDYATWSSSDSSIAKVDQDGNVTGVKEGTAVITAATQSGKTADCTVTVETRKTEELDYNFDQLPREIYKYNTYNIEVSSKMTKLSPVKIEWKSSSANVKVSSAGTNGLSGCKMYVENVQSVKNRGEKITLTATVTYNQVSKKGSVEKTKIFKKTTTSYNLSYDIKIDSGSIVFTKRNESKTVSAILNQGKTDDQPTNTKLKWMMTDSTGKKDNNAAKVASVSGKGVIKAKGPGIAYVTVYAVDSYVKKTKTYTVYNTIQVVCTPVSQIGFSDSSITLKQSESSSLKEKLVFNNGTKEPYNKDGMKLKWSSSDKKNISVNAKGVVKVAKKAVKGSYTITVEATGGVQKGQTVPKGEITIVVPE